MTVFDVYGKFPLNAVNSQLEPRENHLTTVTGGEMYFQPANFKHCELSKDFFFYPEFEVCLCTYIYMSFKCLFMLKSVLTELTFCLQCALVCVFKCTNPL